MALYLGLDASTQSLTAMLVDIDGARRRVVYEHTFTYDAALPRYQTTHGVRRGGGAGVVVSPPLMWVEALDRMIGALASARPNDMARLAAIAGSAQQHGSVYLNGTGLARIGGLDPKMPLAAQMGNAFSRPDSPVWMDSSTSEECGEIARALGGDTEVARRTGSRPLGRFTGPQIRRFFKRDPAGYEATRRVHLVSSFLASLLAGADAPIDAGDGAGMNLLDLAAGLWWRAALDATAPDLEERLPPVAPSWSVVGTLARYWRERYGLPAARVVAWSGDNPCSLVGSGLSRPGSIAISLGTSDTLFGPLAEPNFDPSLAGSVFGSPMGGFMGITVFRNGSLARERMRDAYRLDWAGFSAALTATPAGNGGALVLPWFESEITPPVRTPGIRRSGLTDADGPANIRGLVEGQMMAMANHSAWMKTKTGAAVTTIHATGGGAANREVLQVAADVFGAEVFQLKSRNSACLGAALRAYHADETARGRRLDWRDVTAGLAEPEAGTGIKPIDANVRMYADLRRRYAEFERVSARPSTDR